MTNQESNNNLRECKTRMLEGLPFTIDDFTIRELKRIDIDIYANWPDYPAPYDMFNTSLKQKPTSERDKRWESYCQNNNSISLVVEHIEQKVVGKYSFFDIDWEAMCINNVGIRIHPDWCNKGYGTRILKAIFEWFLENGIVKIKFDVLSTNHRAINCYENAGFKITEEFKREDATFYWMELTRDLYSKTNN